MTRQLKLDITTLHDLQLVSHLDYYFAKTMAAAFHETSPLVLVSCALASQAVSDGHICIDLKKKAGTHNFLVISGGPGTGKTYITTLIKTLLDRYAESCKTCKPRILAVAPTGKAASRLANGRTIHSVLSPLRGQSGFLYNQGKNRY